MLCSVQQTRSMIFAEICARIPYPTATGELCAISLWWARESFFFFLLHVFFSVCFLVRISSVVGQALKCVREHFVPTLHAMLAARIEVRWSLPYYRGAASHVSRPRQRQLAFLSPTARFFLFFISPLTCRRCEQIAQVAANSVDDVRSERTENKKQKRKCIRSSSSQRSQPGILLLLPRIVDALRWRQQDDPPATIVCLETTVR